jgi:tetratricopeptide (TPR) repeat protein
VKEAFPRLWSSREPIELALGRLPARAIERLVKLALGEDVPEETVRDLIERSGGNAFFLEELVRAIASGSTGRLPDSVIAIVQARLDALDPEARRVLRAASFFGRDFTVGAVSALVGAEGEDAKSREQRTLQWLGWLVERELVVRRDAGAFAFRHGLVRDAAYAMVTDEDRSLGHLLAARHLEAHGERDAALLAEHFARGGAPADAARLWLVAAAQALEASDLAAAIDRARRALEMGTPDAGHAHLLMAEAHRWRGEYDRAAKSAAAAIELLPFASVRWFQAAAETATASAALGDRATLSSIGDALARAATEIPSPGAIVALARVALQLMSAGDFARADVLIERATAAPPVEGALIAQARIEQALALRAALSSFFGEAAERTMRSLEAFRRAGDERNACNQEITLAHAMLELGQYEEGRRHLQHGIAVAEHMGLVPLAANARHLLGILHLREGRIDAAIDMQKEARDVFAARGNVRLEGGACCWLAMAHLAAGDPDAAELASLRALELLAHVPPARALALAVHARVSLEKKNVAGALEAASEARALLDRPGGIDTGESLVRLVHAEVLLAAGRNDEAKNALAAAAKRLRERAARIRRDEWRETFLARIPENAKTIDLAQ